MSWLDTLEDIRRRDFSKASPEDRDRAARDVINLASYACAVVAVSPIPFSDAVLMLPVQSAMVITIGHIHGRRLTQADAGNLVMELGTTVGVGLLARQGLKALLPVVGALLTVPAAFAANWAMGRVALEYFKHPDAPRERLKKVYEAARDEGAKVFSRERYDAFRKGKTQVARNAPPPPPPEPVEPDEEVPPEPSRAARPGAHGSNPPSRKTIGKKAAPESDDDDRSEAARLIEDDFADRLREHPEVRKAFKGILHLDVSGDGGGVWSVDLSRPKEWIRPGRRGTPAVTVRCTTRTLVGLLSGKKSAQMAMLSGELQLEPMDLEKAAQLAPLFSDKP